ncbi:MAG: hypothetical protein N2038_11745 [Geminicoccaceae bacterium]|nr:hypothetical protein [Geminicoccaceae bacterium]MCS7266828.1 hypothetical protein [Geminicoccaceae bacterium]MCX7630908.1 hypothetical protein [Geminicoccaceae bacterium]MDW8125862.1 hypothetical protein [Geminicoccaceae bacterium]MDW8342071.1 hypothetical protein [Geminicoccaceae bacterium]
MVRAGSLCAALLIASHPAAGHDWYQGLRNPVGELCCGVRDCAPVAECALEGRAGVVHRGACVPIPPDRLVPIPSPDGRAHLCTRPHPTLGERIVCVILPGSA